jgi:hypothetical protein
MSMFEMIGTRLVADGVGQGRGDTDDADLAQPLDTLGIHVRDYGFGNIEGTGRAARARQSGGVQNVTLPHTGLVLSYPRFVLDPPSGLSAPMYLQADR